MAYKFNPFTGTFDYYESGGGGGGASTFIEVANYTALPAAGTAPGQTYIVLASQGTPYIGGLWGGTYYGKGYYYDTGSAYIYTEVPYQATQVQVDTGTDTDKFVTPNTLTNATVVTNKVIKNANITGATKTKITYDAKGLVTGGADATTADIADSLNKRYVTDANLVVIGNTSGVNSGDNAINTGGYVVASGTNAYTATLSPVPSAYITGMQVRVKIQNTNTTTATTFNFNSLGVKNIKGADGGSIGINSFTANSDYLFVYDGTDFILQAGIQDRKDAGFYIKAGNTTYVSWVTSRTVGSLSTNNTTHTQNVLRIHPVIIGKRTTFDSIGVKVTVVGTAGSVMRLMIYNMVNGLPTTLVLDAGTIPLDSVGFQTIAINVTLEPGMYGISENNNAASSPTCVVALAAAVIPILGHTATNSTLSPITYLTLTQTYGAAVPDISGELFVTQVVGHLLIYLHGS